MKKEVVTAISIGVFIGLVITYGIYLANKSLKSASEKINYPANSAAISPSASPQSPDSAGSAFVLTSPDDETLTNQSSLAIRGTTTPGSYIIILSESSEQVVTPDKSGAFTAQITLDTGYNNLKIISVDPAGTQSVVERLVTYSTNI